MSSPPALSPDVDMTTCSPEMLNGSSAEIATRVRATNLNQTIESGHLFVTCGTIMGKLHIDKFYCPGIHMKCIELDDGEMITPRNMVTIADKERLKDWKTAVRVNGMPIRRFMERGLLDFHDHANTCTMKCLSRAGAPTRDRESVSPVPPSDTPTDQGSSAHDNEPQSPPDYESGESPPSPVPLSLMQSQLPVSTTTAAVAAPLVPLTTPTSSRSKRKRQMHLTHSSMIPASMVPPGMLPTGILPSMLSSSLVPTSMVPIEDRIPKIQRKRIGADFDAAELGLFQENEDCQVFWKGILRVGMLDQIVNDIVHEIHNLKRSLVMSGVGRDEARRLSKIVKQLGMSEQIQNKVLTQKTTMQKEKEALRKEMDELKRRVAAAEQRQYDLKRKAASLDQLMDFTLKRPALMDTEFGSDSDPEPEMAQFVKEEVEESASSDTGSFTSHVDLDAQSRDQESSQQSDSMTPQKSRRKTTNMLENVLKKLKEK